MTVGIVAVLLVVAGCSSNGDDNDNDTNESASTASEVADASDVDDDYVPPADYVGYQITGDPGASVKVIAEVSTASYTPEPTQQMWDLQGRPVHMLFDETVVSGRVTFELLTGESAHVSIIRGAREDPTSNLSPVNVTTTISEATVTPEGTVSLDFVASVPSGQLPLDEEEIAPAPEPETEELETEEADG